MSCALKSAFFRYRKAGLPIYVLILSVVISMAVFNYVNSTELAYFMFARPRFYDNTVVIYSMYYLMFFVPFLSAIYCMIFTGSDISERTINNKVVTGISRTAVYLADLVFNIISTVASLIISVICIFVYAKLFPIRESVSIDARIIELFLYVSLVCLAFTTLFTLIFFFFSNKFFGIVVSLLLVPCVLITSESIMNALNNPYRYSYEDKETGETKWSLNPNYVGGTSRKVLTFLYEASPYSHFLIEENNIRVYSVSGAGAVIVISTALGYLTVSRKEYS